MWGIQVAAATVDVDDPVSVPDGRILFHPASEKDCGRMADDTGSVLVGAYAVWFHPTPDAGVVIISRKAVDKMKVLLAHREIQAVRQAGEKTQDTVSF